MTQRLCVCLGIAVWSLGMSLALGPSSATGALPVKKGTYRGKTSQGLRVEIKMTRNARVQDFADSPLRTRCLRLGRVNLFAFDSIIPVARDGRFRSTFLDVESANLPRAFIDGRQRRLFDITRYELSGRFDNKRLARGNWRAHSVLTDWTTLSSGAGPLDSCDTGVVSWTARLRR
jgi:hypothetical protein